MKKTVFAFSWLLSLSIQAQDSTYSPSQELRGSGRIVRETKTIAPFTQIQTQQFPTNITVEIGGNESSVDISLDDNLRPYLRIDQKNGILKLSFAEPTGKPFWISKSTISVKIRTPQLTGFSHGSNSDVMIQGLSGERFDLANKANGNVTLRGQVVNFNLTSTANGGVQAEELLTQTINVVAQANATLRVNSQNVNEVKTGHAQVINVAKPTK